MFSCEPNGYSKKEVDSYISSLKAESEKIFKKIVDK